MDRCNRAAARFAHRFSASWRVLERYRTRISRNAFVRECAQSFYLSRSSSRRPPHFNSRHDAGFAVRCDYERSLKASDTDAPQNLPFVGRFGETPDLLRATRDAVKKIDNPMREVADIRQQIGAERRKGDLR